MTTPPPAPRQRLRLTYRHGEELRYISHLDLIRTFERALRRAGLPVAYSQGFNPRPRATWAAPLPLGFTGEGEVADFIMERPVPPAEFAARLVVQLPPGLSLLDVRAVPRKAPALPALLRQIRYRVVLPGQSDLERAKREIEWLMASTNLERPRRAKGDKPGKGTYDLRPRVVSLGARAPDQRIEIEMLLCAGENDTARPEEVLDALGYVNTPTLVTRLELIFGETETHHRVTEGTEIAH